MSLRAGVVQQDPDEKMPVGLNWAYALPSGVTISSSTWTYGTLTSSGSASNTTTATTSKLVTGGTVGTEVEVENTVTLSDGQIMQAHVLVRIR